MTDETTTTPSSAPPADLATALEEWLENPWVKWEGPGDLVAWARPFGADLDRAWAAAERPEYLMAIAGVHMANPLAVLDTALACARASLVHVPQSDGRARRAVSLAEQWRPGGDVPQTEIDAVVAAFDELATREENEQRAYAEAIPRFRAAYERVIHEAVKAARSESVRRGEDAETFTRRAATGTTAALLEAHAKDPALVLMSERLRARHVARAHAFATGAAASALVAVGSLAVGHKTFELANRLAEEDASEGASEDAAGAAASADRQGRIAKAAHITLRSTARVYTESALVFSHAAEAEGEAALGSDRVMRAAEQAFASALVEATLASGPVNEGAGAEARRAVMAGYREAAVEGKLRGEAERVRAGVAVGGLRDATDVARPRSPRERDEGAS